jgi:hypothetical protein
MERGGGRLFAHERALVYDYTTDQWPRTAAASSGD